MELLAFIIYFLVTTIYDFAVTCFSLYILDKVNFLDKVNGKK